MCILPTLYLTAGILKKNLKYERRESQIKKRYNRKYKRDTSSSPTQASASVDSILLHLAEKSQSLMPTLITYSVSDVCIGSLAR